VINGDGKTKEKEALHAKETSEDIKKYRSKKVSLFCSEANVKCSRRSKLLFLRSGDTQCEWLITLSVLGQSSGTHFLRLVGRGG
jgi:hypothetical protein